MSVSQRMIDMGLLNPAETAKIHLAIWRARAACRVGANRCSLPRANLIGCVRSTLTHTNTKTGSVILCGSLESRWLLPPSVVLGFAGQEGGDWFQIQDRGAAFGHPQIRAPCSGTCAGARLAAEESLAARGKGLAAPFRTHERSKRGSF